MSFSEIFSVLSDSTRRDTLLYLKDGAKNAGQIAEHFNMSNAAISYHLSKLKKADLIREYKVKNYIYYELNMSIFQEAISWLMQFQKEGNNHEE